jgi:exonuclease SbcC
MLAAMRKEIEERLRVVSELDEAEKRVNETSKLKERLAVTSEAAARRLKEKETERDKAKAADERLNVIEADYKAHVAAQESLDSLEEQRAERDKLKNEAAKVESSIIAAMSEVKRLESEIAKAIQAGIEARNLQPLIEEQKAFEKKREALIAKRAQAQSAKERLHQIEDERQTLREQYKQIKTQIEEAEKHKTAEERFQSLQSERIEVETNLSENEKAATSLQHLLVQRKEAAREVERLKKEIVAREKEIAELEKLSSLAAKAASLLARENELTETLAHLRASKERDEKFQAEVRNGLCPILSQRCLNLKEGQTLEDYFKGQFSSYKTQLALLENEKKQVGVAVQRAREAEKHLSKLERANKQLLDERKLLEERQKTLDHIESELAALPADAKERVKDLRQKLVLMDAELISQREAAMRYAELRPLQQRLKEIENEGKNKAKENETVKKIADELKAIEKEISSTEQSLSDLKDPSQRAVALAGEAEREGSLKVELEGAKKKLDDLQRQSSSLNEQLVRFKELDAMWNEARARRDSTAAAYREYLAAKPLAEELLQRQDEFEKATQEHERATQAAKEASQDYERAVSLYDRERHAQERASLSSARERAAATEADYKNAKQREAALDQELKRLAEIRDSMRDEFKQKEKLDELQDATEFIRDTLKAAGPIVTESYLYNINLEANQLFREISGDASRTLKWSRDYEVMLEESGYERSFQNLSGGEQMAAALSVRLALLKQLSDIRVAFFDEPTINMDAERRERLAQQIRQIQHFDQLFVISHDDTFENAVDSVVNVESRKENGASVRSSKDE